MRLISITEAARLIGMHPQSLRRLSPGDWAKVKIGRLRVYRIDPGRYGERRYDADEILRLQRQSIAKKER